MNNINSQELGRAVVTDGIAKKATTEPANTGVQGGNNPPEAARVSQQTQQETTSVRHDEKKSEQVAQAVSQLNDYVQSLQRDLRFTVDDNSGKSIVSVIDSNSQKVIRQIPNETALQLARNLKDQQEVELRESNHSISQANLSLINTSI